MPEYTGSNEKHHFGNVSFFIPAGWGLQAVGPTQVSLTHSALPAARILVAHGPVIDGFAMTATQVASGVASREGASLRQSQLQLPISIGSTQGSCAIARAQGDSQMGHQRIEVLAIQHTQTWVTILAQGGDSAEQWNTLAAAASIISQGLEISQVLIEPQGAFVLESMGGAPSKRPNSGKKQGIAGLPPGIRCLVGPLALPLTVGWSQVPTSDPRWSYYSFEPPPGWAPRAPGSASLLVGELDRTAPVEQVLDGTLRPLCAGYGLTYLSAPENASPVAELPSVRIRGSGPGLLGLAVGVDTGRSILCMLLLTRTQDLLPVFDEILAQAQNTSTDRAAYAPSASFVAYSQFEGTIRAEQGDVQIPGVGVIPYGQAGLEPPKQDTRGGNIQLFTGAAMPNGGCAGALFLTVWPNTSLPDISVEPQTLARIHLSMAKELPMFEQAYFEPKAQVLDAQHPQANMAVQVGELTIKNTTKVQGGLVAMVRGQSAMQITWWAEQDPQFEKRVQSLVGAIRFER